MLRFTPIDIDAHGRECVTFRSHSFAVSFGSSKRFFAEWGRHGERHLDHLRNRMRELPGSCVHAWQGRSLLGQIELRGGREDPSEGYVNLYYLVPEARGTGVAPELDRYAIAWFSGHPLGGRSRRMTVHDVPGAIQKLRSQDSREFASVYSCTVGVFRTPADSWLWERHSDGDELLYFLEGELDMTLLRESTSEQVALRPFSASVQAACAVPQRWRSALLGAAEPRVR